LGPSATTAIPSGKKEKSPFLLFRFEIVVFLCYFLLDQKVAKKSSRTEAVSGISPPARYLFNV
jgi:hypothetical protein